MKTAKQNKRGDILGAWNPFERAASRLSRHDVLIARSFPPFREHEAIDERQRVKNTAMGASPASLRCTLDVH